MIFFFGGGGAGNGLGALTILLESLKTSSNSENELSPQLSGPVSPTCKGKKALPASLSHTAIKMTSFTQA